MSNPQPTAIQSDVRVTSELQWEIEQFLYAEARLLDNREFEKWYELLADEIHYYMPARSFVYEEQVREGFSAGFGGSNFDDDKERMGYRVRKLLTGRDHIERPHSMLRHHVSNVQIEPSEAADTYQVRSYFIVTRLRHTRFKDIYSGERTDVLRRAANSLRWEIVRREILLDETTMLGGGIGFFF